jgi:hypothetical protein
VNDKRGNTSIEWIDASPDDESPTVELEGLDAGLSIEREKTEASEVAYDPYSNPTDRTLGKPSRRRRNLRQLSEWIKAVRKVKQAKAAASDQCPADADPDANFTSRSAARSRR